MNCVAQLTDQGEADNNDSESNRVIFWDFDGTLGYRSGGWTGTLHEILVSYDPLSRVTVEDLRPFLQSVYPWHTPEVAHPELSDAERWWEHVLPTFVRAYRGVGVSETAAEELASKFRSRYLDPAGWILYPDVLPTFSALRRRGWRHRIITNHVPEFPSILASLGLSGLVDKVTNSAEVGYEKPHPEIFRLALEAAGNPTSAWMVGDNVKADILGAEQAGISAILVRRVDPRARWNCHSLEEVLTIIP